MAIGMAMTREHRNEERGFAALLLRCAAPYARRERFIDLRLLVSLVSPGLAEIAAHRW